MHTLVMAADLPHMPIRTLALYAQRTGQVVACVSTWFRIIAEREWLRPRLRLYPDKPTIGIRAQEPNGLWHIDTSIVRLLDGSRAYIHAVIDNFSRRILAWTVADQGGGLNPVEVLKAALVRLDHPVDCVEVMVDGGSENFNEREDALFGASVLERVLARSQEVVFSNSMIEAFRRSLRHQWLHLHHLDSVAAVRRLTAFYVEQHNTVMPHAAFHGQTPDEVHFGHGDAVLQELAEKRQQARKVRNEYNLSRICEACPRAAPALLESNRTAQRRAAVWKRGAFS